MIKIAFGILKQMCPRLMVCLHKLTKADVKQLNTSHHTETNPIRKIYQQRGHH